MKDFEKLGLFYLGKMVDPATGELEKELLLYESKYLMTHAVCVGMTGSGKTGLGITILEEGALDKIPAIVIDPKGDLGNLLLTFPNLSPQEFQPWTDPAEAEKKGMDTTEYAKFVSNTWKEGLKEWGEDAERVKKFRDSVDLTIYTPASRAGVPISILSSFAAPTKEDMEDATILRDRIQSLTSSLLGLLSINADPLKSREHILIATLIQQAWQNGENLDIGMLIQQVQKPPFKKIGALDIDTFYPPKDRMALSISLNNLLASPGFQAWMEGAPLDISQLFHTEKGKPKLSIISIAHLADSERMFFVTLLLNEILTWMRRQSGTSSLRAILYMDEIFGFFPPTAMPPSKLPMLTLLKQARAFGLGVVLATQNPVDLDYKGLSNCGTWFIGKLQTDRDKSRVLEGLNIASNGQMNSETLDSMIALTGKRMFIMRSIYEKEPILFQTRWTLSYLRGPLTLAQITRLTDKSKVALLETAESLSTQKSSEQLSHSKPAIPAGVSEFFVNVEGAQPPLHYESKVVGLAKLHFVDAKAKVDVWKDVCFALSVEGDGSVVEWAEGRDIPNLKNQMKKEPSEGSTFGELPPGLMQEKNYPKFSKDFSTALYQNEMLTIYRTSSPNMVSKAGESERDFRVRVAQEMREKRDELVKKVRDKYAVKIASLKEKVRRAEDRMAQKQQKMGLGIVQTVISFLSVALGALFGRGISKGTITETGTSLKRATQWGKNSQDISQAKEGLDVYQEQLENMEDQMNSEIAVLNADVDGENIPIETTEIRPRKGDIAVEQVALLWWA